MAATEHRIVFARKLRTRYLIPKDQSSPAALRRKLDSVAAEALPRALAKTLAGVLPREDRRVWFLRKLVVKVSIDSAWDANAVAREWARAIVKSLLEAIASGSSSGNTVRFPDYPSFLARFVFDLANGRAWGRWYYRSFAGLRPLSVSAAVRTAICRDPPVGLLAMLKLAPTELVKVLRVLSARDARLVLEAFAGNRVGSREVSSHTWVQLAKFAGESRGWTTLASEMNRALFLCIDLARDPERMKRGTISLEALVAIVYLEEALRSRRNSDDTVRLLASLRTRDFGRLALLSGIERATSLRALMTCPPTSLHRVCDELVGAAAPAIEPVCGKRRWTAFGGVFLLLPLIDGIPLASPTADWPGVEETSAADLLRFLVLLRCLPRGARTDAFRDPLLRDLMLISAGLRENRCQEWIDAIERPHADSLRSELALWQRRTGAVGDGAGVTASTTVDERSATLLMDTSHGTWIDLAVSSGQPPRLPVVLTESGRGEGPAPAAPTDPPRIRSDLDYLLEKDEELAWGGLSAALVVTAQTVLRCFARRLPGFSTSTFDFLVENFFPARVSLEDEEDRRVVRLSRPPLDVVLSLSGAHRQTYTLSWLDQRPFKLFPEE